MNLPFFPKITFLIIIKVKHETKAYLSFLKNTLDRLLCSSYKCQKNELWEFTPIPIMIQLTHNSLTCQIDLLYADSVFSFLIEKWRSLFCENGVRTEIYFLPWKKVHSTSDLKYRIMFRDDTGILGWKVRKGEIQCLKTIFSIFI